VANRHRGELAVESSAGSAADHADDRLMLLAAMRGLPAEQRETLALHYLADLPIEAIADRMDVPLGTVKARLSRGRNALAAVLTQDTQDIAPSDDLRSARQPEFSAVRQRAARRARRRIAAAAAILTVVVSAGAVWGSGRFSRPEPVTPTPTPSPSVVPPSTSPTPGARADVRNTTLSLPDARFTDACGKGGNLKFVDGTAAVGGATWSIGEMAPVEGDLDGAPGPELVTTISCDRDNSLQLVALKATPGGELRVLGYVLPLGTDLLFDAANVRIEAGVVQVTMNSAPGHTGPRCLPNQLRGYSYRDGSFRQTSGPTTMPELPLDIRQVDLRNTPLAVAIRGQSVGTSQLVCASMNDGTGSATLRADSSTGMDSYAFTIESNSFATGQSRDFAIARVSYRVGNGPQVESVQAIHRATDGFEGQILLSTGVDGVTGIDSVRVNDNRVIVTVIVNGGKQTWTYTEKPPGSDVWARD
jgi:hypothetical protein